MILLTEKGEGERNIQSTAAKKKKHLTETSMDCPQNVDGPHAIRGLQVGMKRLMKKPGEGRKMV